MRVLSPHLGLRTRLVAAFLLVAAISAATTAALTYREARSAVLEQAQDTAVGQFRDRVAALGPGFPLDAPRLRSLCETLAREGKPHTWIVFAEYAGMRASSSDRPTSQILTEQLRRAARENAHASFQRVVRDDRAWLTIGMPVMFDQGDGRHSTGLVMYAVMPLAPEEANIAAMVTAARNGALPALLVAVVPALLAARSVIRPVRDLRRAAAGIGRGELGTRISVRGSDELAQLARTFNESAVQLQSSVDELRQAEERARRFASDVSHELRTPLTGMLAVTEILDEEAAHLNADTAAAVRLISAETGKLATLVDDLMEISRFDAKAAGLHTDEVDVAEAVRKSLQARRWEDRVACELPDGVRATLDPRRFDVIVANLVGNALRHGGEPVTVRLRPEERDGTPLLVLEVADAGAGIPPEALPYVFDRFYKADAARTRSKGSGLGLAITRENVRLHGGTVHGANGTDGGAVFTVELPRGAG
ncbi:ATP-binding protein [Streptomyces sp. NPDC060198]|uniref:ATP-binding protein n=1 Tax=Streptomyces sp. NPDC060198 TaxID=3347070 RepID=UPI0036656937